MIDGISKTNITTKPTRESIEVSIGSSNPVIDGIRNILSIPMKLLFLNVHVNSGHVSPEVIEKMKNYLHEKGLHDVTISVNEYNPLQVWQKVFSNPRTSIFSKFTLGILTGLLETLSFNKLSGQLGDHFNTSSNTIHIFSNDESIALHECGHAEDVNNNPYPSLYFYLLSVIPMGKLWLEAQATKNAWSYLEKSGDAPALKRSYKTLVPGYATYVHESLLSLGAILSVFDDSFNVKQNGLWTLISIMGIAHIAARVAAASIQIAPIEEKTSPFSFTEKKEPPHLENLHV